ncbi:MAG TPA: tetratricopeptide repeat protein [Terriglobales bacterium]|nr:tetratricopeptide repeat protein [Terriglobales bacterium]
MRHLFWLPLLLIVTTYVVAQQENQPPRSPTTEPGESSSRSTKIDLSPPSDDNKAHPDSENAVSDANDANGDVQEMRPWDPHKAMKDLEVGDFYFKRKNYKAALDRYQEALLYKPNDALSNFHIGECQEKLKHPDEARTAYEAYLKILPQGPLSAEAHKALDRLKTTTSQKTEETVQ